MSTKSTVRHRKGAADVTNQGRSSDARQGDNTGKSRSRVTDIKTLTSALQQARQGALSSGMSPEEFQNCAERASKRLKLLPLEKKSGVTRSFRCCRLKTVLKVTWLVFLGLMTVALLAAAVKPVMFYVHMMVHTHMYSITRPVRIALVSILPLFQKLGIDFLHQDCLVENPFLSQDERCPCTYVKYPTVFTINSSFTQLPSDLLHPPLSQIIEVKNGISVASDFTIDKIIQFGGSGPKPRVCTEMTVEGQSGLLYYQDLFKEKKMKKYLKMKEPWTFSWEECPLDRRPITFRSMFPSPSSFLPPHVNMSTNSLFTVTTQWAPSSFYPEIFSEHRLILTTVVLGEVRIVPEPVLDSQCNDICSGFKGHLLLKQGDSLIFDQQFWSFQATTWSDIALTYSVALI